MSLTQHQLNEEAVRQGIDRYERGRDKAIQRGSEIFTKPVRVALSRCIEQVKAGLDLWIRESTSGPGKRSAAVDHIIMLPSNKVAALASHVILDGLSKDQSITAVAGAIGRALQNEYIFQSVDAELWRQLNREVATNKSPAERNRFIIDSLKDHGIYEEPWGRREGIRVGLVLIDLFMQYTGLIKTVTYKEYKNKSKTRVVPSDSYTEWLKKFDDHNSPMNPVWLPMVRTPIDWNNIYIGGYNDPRLQFRPLVKTRNTENLEKTGEYNLDKIYKAVNHLQRVPYVIDKRILEVAKYCWKENIHFDGMPFSERLQAPPKPDKGSEDYAQWKAVAGKTYKMNLSLDGQRYNHRRIIDLAEKYKEHSVYFPLRLCFRGRGYCSPAYLNYQSNDLARASLLFRNGQTGRDNNSDFWIRVHTANCWGRDKDTYEERLAWFENNAKMIEAIAKDPFKNIEWTKADAPFRFLQACFESMQYLQEGHTQLPVGIDCSCQGLQIYSMLLRDPVAARNTNVLPTDRYQDVYSLVADSVNNRLKTSSHPYANDWLKFGIDRKTTKRQTMTLSYGSTMHSCQDYTADWFFEQLRQKKNPFGTETYKPATWLGRVVWDSIGEVVKSSQVGMECLRGIANQLLDMEIFPQWNTPMGFPVFMEYEKTKAINIKTRVHGTIRQHRAQIPSQDGSLRRRKTVDAICANFIHSLDGFGGILGKTVSMCDFDMYAVHDEFDTLPKNVSQLSGNVRQATAELFNEDLFGGFVEEMSRLSGLQFETPAYGDLDVSQVRKSLYYCG